MKYFGLVLVLVALFAGIQPTTAQAPNDKQIVPGIRVGPVSVGMSDADLYKVLGDPTDTDTLHYRPSIAYRYTSFFVIVNRDSHKVTQIATSDPSYSTAEGIKAGSSGLGVSVKYGVPGPCSPVYGCNYNYPNGISLGINPNGSVSSISVYQAGGAHY